MLKKFTVGNFLSFHHHQSFTMSSTGSQRVVETPHGAINQFSALFGQHKADLCKAIKYASNIITNGTPPTQPTSFSNNKQDRASFDFEIYVDQGIYSIGFEIDTTNNEIIEQWMIDIAKGKKEILYYINTSTENYTYKKELFDEKEFASILNKKDTHSLIISDVVHNSSQYHNNNDRSALFGLLFQWFSQIIVLDNLSSFVTQKPTILPLSYNMYELASIFEGNITPLSYEKRIQLEEIIEGDDAENLVTIHNNSLCLRITTLDNSIWYEAILDTQNDTYLQLLYVLLTTNDFPPLIIEDVEKDLNPALTYSLVKTMFRIMELKNIQCIITTEETSLLQTRILKKNEIWFITSNESHASHLISYDCFFFEQEIDIEEAYLSGEFDSL